MAGYRKLGRTSPFVPEFPAPAHRAKPGSRSSARPPAAATAQASVEAKMRSGSGENTQPERFRRPSMQRVELPAPGCVRRSGSEMRPGLQSPAPAPHPAARWCLWRRPLPARASPWPPRWGSAGDLCPVQAGRSRQHQPAGACLPTLPPPSGAARPDAGRWAAPRCCTRRASSSRHGPALPAAAHRRGWTPAFVRQFAPEGCCSAEHQRQGYPPLSHRAAACAPQKRQARRPSKSRHGPQAHIATRRIDAASGGSTLFSPPGCLHTGSSRRPPITTIRFP